MNASEFIRTNPHLKAKELIQLGKKDGLNFSAQLVYQVRSAGKRKPKKNGAKKARRTRKVRRVNGKRATAQKSVPVSLSAIVEQFKEDLNACFKQTVSDAMSEWGVS